MMKHLRYMAVAALATVGTACSEAPTNVNEEFDGELVITEGVAAPEYVARVRPVLSQAAAAPTLVGSATTPLALKPVSCEPQGQSVEITYSISGPQRDAAAFTVNTLWSYNGTAWTGSTPTTVQVPARGLPGNGPATIGTVVLTVLNSSETETGTSSFVAVPTLVPGQEGGSPGLQVSGAGSATVHVAFNACPVVNTAPTLVLPEDFTVEATSASGATVSYIVTATDAQDGVITSSVTCTPASGDTFALGLTTVNCSVTDAGGLTTTGSFNVTVEDTTPAYFTSFPTGTVNLIAANISGAVLDIDALGIAVADVGNVSEPSTFECDYVAGTTLEIGSVTTVNCTAKDAIGNESDPSSFDVFVGLDLSGINGFLSPLRMVSPFSTHKRGSTIPHKFLPPAYADGTLATDLADGLNLTLRRIDASVDDAGIDGTEYAAGSTAWRYDAESGHYIFNLKTGTSSPWDPGTWTTTASFAGITLATTRFDLKR